MTNPSEIARRLFETDCVLDCDFKKCERWVFEIVDKAIESVRAGYQKEIDRITHKTMDYDERVKAIEMLEKRCASLESENKALRESLQRSLRNGGC